MRKMKIFLSLVAVLLLWTSLTAYANEKTSNKNADALPDVQLNAVEIHDDDPQGDPDAGNQDMPIPHEPVTENEMNGDGEEYPDIHDGYYHQIGDAEFYTEHNLDDYIFPNPVNPVHYCIGMEAMLHDVWGTDGGLFEPKDGYVYSDGSSFTKGISFGRLNDDDRSAGSYLTVGYTLDKDYSSTVTCYSEPSPDEGYIVVYQDPGGFGFTRDMAALALYLLEQNESNPRTNIASELGLPSNYECGH